MGWDVCCSYFKGDTCIESYVAHVKRSLTVWSKLKQYYITTVKRLLKVEVDPVEIALLFHDAGKLVEAYRGNRQMFRHEIIGSYVVYKVLESLGFDEDARATVSLAVLLHHEPIIFSAYVSGLGERYLTVSIVKKVIGESDLTIYCGSHLGSALGKLVDSVAGLSDDQRGGVARVGREILLSLNTRKDDILKVVKSIVVKSSIGDSIELHKTRAKVAGLLHPLVVSDSVAAYIGRSLCLHGGAPDEGTWVVKRALAQAELLDEEMLRNALCEEG